MNVSKWIESQYKKVYTRFGGEPWTWTVRKSTPVAIAFLGVGLFFGYILAKHWKVVIPSFILGFIFGHFFW